MSLYRNGSKLVSNRVNALKSKLAAYSAELGASASGAPAPPAGQKPAKAHTFLGFTLPANVSPVQMRAAAGVLGSVCGALILALCSRLGKAFRARCCGGEEEEEEEVRAHRKKRPWYRDVRHSNEYDDESEELEDHEVESLRSRARSSRSSRRGPSRTAPTSIVTLDPSPESEDGYEAEPEEKTSKVLVEL